MSLITQLVKIHLQCRRSWFDSWVRKIPWRREKLPTPVFWPEEFHGLYSPWLQRVGPCYIITRKPWIQTDVNKSVNKLKFWWGQIFPNIVPQNRNELQRDKNNFTMKNLARNDLNQVIKINNISNEANCKYVPLDTHSNENAVSLLWYPW